MFHQMSTGFVDLWPDPPELLPSPVLPYVSVLQKMIDIDQTLVQLGNAKACMNATASVAASSSERD